MADPLEPAERDDGPEPDEPQSSDRFRHLPEPVRLEDTIATKDPDPPPDPDGGRDPDRDFMLRYGFG